MRWFLSLLLIFSFYATSVSSQAYASSTLVAAGSSVSSVSSHFPLSLSIKHSHLTSYKKIKISKGLSRLWWIIDKKIDLFSTYNKLNKTVCSQSLAPSLENKSLYNHFIIILPTDYGYRHDTRTNLIQSWLNYLTYTAHRMVGWKESNTLYKGSLTYH